MAKEVLCPNCGVWHEIGEDPPRATTFENRVRRPMFKTDAMAGSFPQPLEGAKDQPVGLPGWDSHVKIPLAQAVIFGLFDAPIGVGIGLAGGVGLAMLFNEASRDNLTPWGYVVIIGTGGFIGGLIALCQEAKKRWPERLEVHDALLWIEEITGVDIDGDGEVGEPEPETLKIELHDGNGIPRLIAEFDTDRERFAELARLILIIKKGFSEETANEAGYSRKEWVDIRDKFFSLQAAAWKNRNHPKQGIDLGSRGINILKAMLPPTLPAGEVTPKNPSGTNGGRRTDDLTGRYDHVQGEK